MQPKESAAVTIKVTPTLVREMGGTLRRLKEQFEQLDDDVEGYAPVDVSGHEKVGAQLLAFSRNWYDRRASMVEEMDGLAKLTGEAAANYELIERQRAGQWRPPGGPRPSPGPGAPPTPPGPR